MGYISEIKSRDDPTFESDYIEVVIPPGEDPSDFEVFIYNRNGTIQTSYLLDETDPDIVLTIDEKGNQIYTISFSISEGSGNGANGAVALTENGVLTQFSAVGTRDVIGVEGPADGATADAPGNSSAGDSYYYDTDGNYIGQDTSTPFAVCFTLGAAIQTTQGPIAIEALQPGMKVITRDNGPQELVWIGGRDLSVSALRSNRALCPIEIARDAFGPGCPSQTMRVSPQHRILVTSPRAELLFGHRELLVPACHLVGRQGIRRVQSPGRLSYYHLLFEDHQLVRSDDIWTESFQPNARALDSLSQSARDELLWLFPQLREGLRPDRPMVAEAARATLRRFEAEILFAEQGFASDTHAQQNRADQNLATQSRLSLG